MAPRRQRRRPNIILIGIDSLRRDHMSCYGYDRLTTPHIDRLAAESTLFTQTFSAHIPTTSAYASMLTGMDVFTTQVVALRHQGPPAAGSQHDWPKCSPERATTRPASASAATRVRAASTTYLDYPGWGSWNEGRSPKAQNLNDVAIPELESLAKKRAPFFLFLRHMDPHAPYLPPEPYERMFYHGNEMRPEQQVHGTGDVLQALLRFLRQLDAARNHRQGLRRCPVRRGRRLYGCRHAVHTHRRPVPRHLRATPSSSSTATTARRSTSTNAGSIITACTSRRWSCRS